VSFGGSTIVFISRQQTGVADSLGEIPIVDVPTSAPGCRHRPLTPAEKVEFNLDFATEYWRSTLPLCEYVNPLLAIAMAAKNTDVIEVDGQEYQIIGGVQPFEDLEGVPFKMTIISQKQTS
jgi:hypothetical protein